MNKVTVALASLCILLLAAVIFLLSERNNTATPERQVNNTPTVNTKSPSRPPSPDTLSIQEQGTTKSHRAPVDPEPKEASSLDALLGSEENTQKFMENMQAMALERVKMRRQRNISRLTRELGLSDAQVQQLEELGADNSWDSGRYTVKQLEEILTEEQLVQYEEQEEKRAEQRKESNALRQLSSIQRDIDLNEDQKDAVYTILYENSDDLRPGERFGNLNTQIASEGGGTETVMEEIVKQREERNAKLLEDLGTVLDQDQLDQYKERLEERNEMIRSSSSLFRGLDFGGGRRPR